MQRVGDSPIGPSEYLTCTTHCEIVCKDARKICWGPIVIIGCMDVIGLHRTHKAPGLQGI